MTPTSSQLRTGPWILAASLAGCATCLFLAGDRLQGLLVNSMLLTGGALLISLPIGTLLAIAIAKTSVLGGKWLERLTIVMLFVPLYVQATAWQATLGQGGWLADGGWLTGWAGAIWIHGVAAVPWMVLFVAATLRKVPREQEEEALQDTAAWHVLIRVSLRHALAGLLAAALWVAVICCSEITVTDLFQVRTFAEEIYTAASLGTLDGVVVETADQVDVPRFVRHEIWLGTLSIVLLAVAALTAIWMWVPVIEFVSPSSDWVWRLRGGRVALSAGVWLIAALVVGLPMAGLLGKAGARITPVDGGVVRDWSPAKAASLIIGSPWEHRRELGWSVAIGAVATAGAVSIAIFVGWALRTRKLPAGPAALLLALGFAIPGPLLGVWLIRCLNHPPDSLLAPLTWCYDHTILAPVLAQFLRALPLAVLILAVQLASVPQDVLDSAKSEGAGWWRQLSSVALPNCWPSVAAAGCLAMIVSLGDLAATLLVVPPGVSPLSVRIFGLLHYGAEDRVSALCLMLTIALAAGVTLAWQIPHFFSDGPNREQ